MYKNKQQKHGIHISFAPSFLSIPDCAVGVYQSRLGLFNPIFFFSLVGQIKSRLTRRIAAISLPDRSDLFDSVTYAMRRERLVDWGKCCYHSGDVNQGLADMRYVCRVLRICNQQGLIAIVTKHVSQFYGLFGPKLIPYQPIWAS